MNPSLFVLDQYGLLRASTDEISEKIWRWPTKKVMRFADLLQTSLPPLSKSSPVPDAPLDFFNFLASSSVRGAAICSQTPCQIAKLDRLGRFAALYADHVVLPVDFSLPDATDRAWLSHSVNAVVHLRALIEEGIILLAADAATCICPACLKTAGISVEDLAAESRRFWDGESDKFTVIYRPPTDPETPFPEFEIRGPAEFLGDHDSFSMEAPCDVPIPKSRLKQIGGAPGAVLPMSALKRQHFLSESVFAYYLSDLFQQQLHSAQLRTTYLTDLPGQARYFGRLGQCEQSSANAARLCSHLAHRVPFLADVPLSAVLKIRRREPEAFIRYRAAVNAIVRDYVLPDKYLSDRHALELYRDCIQPSLAELHSQSKAQSVSKVVRHSVPWVAAITVGTFGGLSLPLLTGLYTMAAKVIGGELASIQAQAAAIRNHNLYFLFRVMERVKLD